MKNIYVCITLLFVMSIGTRLYAQLSITADGSPPDSAAMLEIKSENKGLLLPRIDYNNKPSTPVAGLLIYVTANGPFGNGLYMGTGQGWSKLGTVGHTKGELAEGGIVFYVDATGMHGLVSALADEPGYPEWGCDSSLIGPGAQHYGLMEGDLNTAAIVAGCSEYEFAAKVCDDLVLNSYSDWYLPSKEEQDSMFYNRDLIGGFVEGEWYWSSSEADSATAVMKINDPAWIPSWTGCNKHYNLAVRCIRKF